MHGNSNIKKKKIRDSVTGDWLAGKDVATNWVVGVP